MTAGILLLIVGGIFAFAVKGDTDAIDLQVMGVILMLGGVGLIYRGRQDSGHLRETTTVDDLTNPNRPVHVVREFYADDQPTDDARIHLPGLDDDDEPLHESSQPQEPQVGGTQHRPPQPRQQPRQGQLQRPDERQVPEQHVHEQRGPEAQVHETQVHPAAPGDEHRRP